MFITLGILIPMVFHGAGLGSIFLPMFWPIAVSAFFLLLPWTVAVAISTPILSTMLTGMPPPPILYKMILELSALSCFIYLFFRKTRLGTFFILMAGMICAEFFAILGSFLIAPILGLPPRLYALSSITRALPGIIIMMVFIPLIIKRLSGLPIFNMRRKDVQSTSRILQPSCSRVE